MSEQRNLNPTDAYDQYGLADDYLMGWDIEIEQDYQKAAYWYEKAAEQGLSLAQESIGDCYRDGTGVEKDNEKAAYWYEKAASNPEEPNVNAQYKLGTLYDLGLGVKRDSKKAAYWYEKAASALRFPNADAQYNLGLMYASGEGVEKDRTKAAYWFEKAASNPRNPNANAQLNLGLFYESGVGVEEDLNKAVYWLEKAAAQGAEGADKALSRVRKEIQEEEEDRQKWEKERKDREAWERARAEKEEKERLAQAKALAEKEMRQAAREKRLGNRDLNPTDPVEQFKLAQFYADLDIDEDEDSTLAAKWYERAAQAGYAPAQRQFAWCCENACGVARNYKEAARWYDKAARQGDRTAKEALGAVLEKLGSGYDGNKYEREREKKIEEARRYAKKATLGAVLFVIAAAAAGYLKHMGSVDIGIDDRTFTFLGVFAVFALSLAIGIFRTFREGFLVCMVIAAIPVLFIAYTSALPIVPLAFALFCLAAAVLIVAVNKTRKFNAPVNRDKLIREYRKTHNN